RDGTVAVGRHRRPEARHPLCRVSDFRSPELSDFRPPLTLLGHVPGCAARPSPAWEADIAALRGDSGLTLRARRLEVTAPPRRRGMLKTTARRRRVSRATCGNDSTSASRGILRRLPRPIKGQTRLAGRAAWQIQLGRVRRCATSY